MADDHLQNVSECPDCASQNIVHGTMRDQIICRDCGLIFEPFAAEKPAARAARPALARKPAKARARPARKARPRKKASRPARKKPAKKKRLSWW